MTTEANDVFGNSEQPVTSTEAEQTLASELDQLVGEGKKYKTAEDLAKSRIEADQFIDKLKGETSEMREEIARLQAELEQRISNANQASGSQTSDGSGEQVGQLSEESIAALVDKRIQDMEAMKSAASNIQEANDAVLKQFGGDRDKASAYLQTKASELGVTIDYLKEQAGRSPSVFKALVGVANTSTGASTSGVGSIPASTAAGGQGGPQPGTMEYFEQMRKSDPNRYFSPQVQNQRFELMKQGKLK